jgi:hypothetical protein
VTVDLKLGGNVTLTVDIKLKFGFRENSRINRRKWTVTKGFDWVFIDTNMYLFTKIWVIRYDIESFEMGGRR